MNILRKQLPLRVVLSVTTVIFAHLGLSTLASAGPASPYYTTAGDTQVLAVIQGSSEIGGWFLLGCSEFAIAVQDGFVNTASANEQCGDSSPGSQYTTAGVFTGTRYAFNGVYGYDGTTDGTNFYTIGHGNSGFGVYEFDQSWSNPTLLFGTNYWGLGITYDPRDDSFYISEFDWAATLIHHYSRSGSLLGSFDTGISVMVGLALDYTDWTLWFGSEMTPTLYQYSTQGVFLSSDSSFNNSLGQANFGGGEFELVTSPNVMIDAVSRINPGSRQKIVVAILTTAVFDAQIVDPQTVQFGPDGAAAFHSTGHVADVDFDGDMDLLLHFTAWETGIACGDTEATLVGETFSGQAFTGTDTIVTVHCN